MINTIQKMYGNKYCQFLSLFPNTEIKETEKYYFKEVCMFGNKELRLFKKSKRITTKKL
jgi:hypothetical protein